MAQKKRKADATKVVALEKKLVAKSQRNSKAQVKKFYTDNGAKIFAEAVAVAMAMDPMPKGLKNGEEMRQWCITNNAPSVQRNMICRKATNYRADNAMRQRLQSWQKENITSAKLDIVWACNHATAMREPFSVQTEKVFIVKM
jgi:hypothetical protein